MPSFPDSVEGPNILKSEVRTAIRMMRRNKAAGPDGVVIEMIDALEDYGVEKLTQRSSTRSMMMENSRRI